MNIIKPIKVSLLVDTEVLLKIYFETSRGFINHLSRFFYTRYKNLQDVTELLEKKLKFSNEQLAELKSKYILTIKNYSLKQYFVDLNSEISIVIFTEINNVPIYFCRINYDNDKICFDFCIDEETIYFKSFDLVCDYLFKNFDIEIDENIKDKFSSEIILRKFIA